LKGERKKKRKRGKEKGKVRGSYTLTPPSRRRGRGERGEKKKGKEGGFTSYF